MFKNNSLIIKAKENIKPEMFLYNQHRNIYLGILDMVKNKMAVELIFMAKIINNRFYVSTETDFSKFVNEIRIYKLGKI